MVMKVTETITPYKEKIQKYTLEVLGKSKITYFFKDDYCVINLSQLIVRNKIPEAQLTQIVDDIAEYTYKIQLTGLPNVCHRLNILYEGPEMLQLLTKLRDFFHRNYPFIYFCENNVNFDGCHGMRPLYRLYYHDKQSGTIYIHKCLQDCLKLIGFQDSQAIEFRNFKKIKDIIPVDERCKLPIVCDDTMKAYKRYCELFGC